MTCGLGISKRRRVYIGGEPYFGGCRGSLEKVIRRCNTQMCQSKDHWSAWTDCDKTCGGEVGCRDEQKYVIMQMMDRDALE